MNAMNNNTATRRTVPVSVIIPAYRARRMLESAIESVAQQTVYPFEVIVVDDASGDDTVEAVRSIQARYPSDWLRLIELPRNVGAGEARNAGWQVARGTCLAFLDADDTWHPCKLELQWEHFSQDPHLVLCGHAHRFPWDPEVNLTESITTQSEPIQWPHILLRNPFVTPSVMVRRDIPIRFHPGKRHMEDHLLWMEIVLNGHVCRKLASRLATVCKPQFGASGLSSHLWAMEKGDLDNYWQLHRKGYIGGTSAFLLALYSLAKFVRRVLIVTFRRVIQGMR